MTGYKINGKEVTKEEWDAHPGAGLSLGEPCMGTVAYSESHPADLGRARLHEEPSAGNAGGDSETRHQRRQGVGQRATRNHKSAGP